MDLKHQIHDYISRKQDIGCEGDIDRKHVVHQIIQIYKKSISDPNEYLDFIQNDLLKLIGYKSHLKENNDLEGIRLWDQLVERTMENELISESKIYILLTQDVPLYFLLSFLGYALQIQNMSM